MADSAVPEQACHCENCDFFDDEPVPCGCRKGRGQVAYLHRICESFQIRGEVKDGLYLLEDL
jgi:hypothetical protein